MDTFFGALANSVRLPLMVLVNVCPQHTKAHCMVEAYVMGVHICVTWVHF